jgi:hypothetical protein
MGNFELAHTFLFAVVDVGFDCVKNLNLVSDGGLYWLEKERVFAFILDFCSTLSIGDFNNFFCFFSS